jgi:hypothetical protein
MSFLLSSISVSIQDSEPTFYDKKTVITNEMVFPMSTVPYRIILFRRKLGSHRQWLVITHQPRETRRLETQPHGAIQSTAKDKLSIV